MSAAVEYPQSAPAEVPPQLRKSGLWRCQYCRNHLHESCPGAVRLQRRGLWLCYCCRKAPRCLECGATAGINSEFWACLDPLECQHRIVLRQRNSPLWNMLQQAKVSGIAERRRRRETEAKIRAALPVDEDEQLDQAAKRVASLRRSSSGNCECCGAPTKGGRFLPGHDAKLKSRLRRQRAYGTPEQQESARTELASRGWD